MWQKKTHPGVQRSGSPPEDVRGDRTRTPRQLDTSCGITALSRYTQIEQTAAAENVPVLPFGGGTPRLTCLLAPHGKFLQRGIATLVIGLLGLWLMAAIVAVVYWMTP
jgi:hypothetical protein